MRVTEKQLRHIIREQLSSTSRLPTVTAMLSKMSFNDMPMSQRRRFDPTKNRLLAAINNNDGELAAEILRKEERFFDNEYNMSSDSNYISMTRAWGEFLKIARKALQQAGFLSFTGGAAR